MNNVTMLTYTGRRFSLTHPRAEDVHLDDIVHHLARLARFTGGTWGAPYSVAQHSVLVDDIVKVLLGIPDAAGAEGGYYRRRALLHDAHEAYTGDISNPMYRAIEEELKDEAEPHPVRDIKRKVQLAIDKALGVACGTGVDSIVKRADNIAVLLEKYRFMAPDPGGNEGFPDVLLPAGVDKSHALIAGAWGYAEAERNFRERLNDVGVR